jgi:hypothetical protein
MMISAGLRAMDFTAMRSSPWPGLGVRRGRIVKGVSFSWAMAARWVGILAMASMYLCGVDLEFWMDSVDSTLAEVVCWVTRNSLHL